MATERAQHWPVPYLSRLEGGGIQPGQSVVIRGIQTGETFNVNLLAGPKYAQDNAPLHISVRQKEKNIVFNTFADGAWGKEEKKKDPFKEGEPFDLRIRAHDNHFEIFANQKELLNFEYRQPLNSINHLFISGELELHNVSWGGKYYPVPYQAGIEGGFTPGKRLFVSGVPDKKAKKFEINLMSNGNDIAMHVSIRFDEKHVVRNSFQSGNWQAEEKEGKFPLEKDIAFDAIIVNEPYAFQVFFNGNHFCSFAHRLDPNSIQALKISGDVELQGVHVK